MAVAVLPALSPGSCPVLGSYVEGRPCVGGGVEGTGPGVPSGTTTAQRSGWGQVASSWPRDVLRCPVPRPQLQCEL